MEDTRFPIDPIVLLTDSPAEDKYSEVVLAAPDRAFWASSKYPVGEAAAAAEALEEDEKGHKLLMGSGLILFFRFFFSEQLFVCLLTRMNLEKSYNHQTTFPLNTSVKLPVENHHFLLPLDCHDWKLAPSYFYFYDKDLQELESVSATHRELYDSFNEPIEEEGEDVRASVLREIAHLFSPVNDGGSTPTTPTPSPQQAIQWTVPNLNRLADYYYLPDQSTTCLWLNERGEEESEAEWSELSRLVFDIAPKHLALLIPHGQIHYLCARLLFTAQLFFPRFRMVKLISTKQWSSVDRCFLLYSPTTGTTPTASSSPMTTSIELRAELEMYNWLLPPSNDFLVKLEFTFFQMVANECFLNEQLVAALLSPEEEQVTELKSRIEHWKSVRAQRWSKIKAETNPVCISFAQEEEVEEQPTNK